MYLFHTCIRAFVKGNLGDDLFIYTLCQRYPDTKFYICGEKQYRALFLPLKNLTYVADDSFLIKWFFRGLNCVPILFNMIGKKKRIAKLSCFNFISRFSRYNILISGSLFMEIGDETFKENSFTRQEKRYYRRRPYVLGCNFGPYHSEAYRQFYEGMFKKASQVSFRDQYSCGLFSGDNIYYAPDILFGLEQEAVLLPVYKDYILISVLNPGKDSLDNFDYRKSDYFRKLEEFIQYAINKKEKIVLLGFCNFQRDDMFIHDLVQKIGINSETHDIITVCYPDITYKEALGYFTNAKAVIATRYHAMIIGWVFGRRVFPISYNEKMRHVIEELTPGMLYAETDTVNAINNDIIYSALSEGTVLSGELLKTEAAGHFHKLDLVLK